MEYVFVAKHLCAERQERNMALMLPVNLVAAAKLRRERLYRSRDDVLHVLDDETFRNRYRFPNAAVVDLAYLLYDDLAQTKRSNALTVVEQLLVTLRFYATGKTSTGKTRLRF